MELQNGKHILHVKGRVCKKHLWFCEKNVCYLDDNWKSKIKVKLKMINYRDAKIKMKS